MAAGKKLSRGHLVLRIIKMLAAVTVMFLVLENSCPGCPRLSTPADVPPDVHNRTLIETDVSNYRRRNHPQQH
ncbi:MAG TPA: hypothetical protein VFB76_14990 [Candidatus Angelobacter sp.]|nr:hypothetical protein [Candidatus Angelobacter sp.]